MGTEPRHHPVISFGRLHFTSATAAQAEELTFCRTNAVHFVEVGGSASESIHISVIHRFCQAIDDAIEDQGPSPSWCALQTKAPCPRRAFSSGRTCCSTEADALTTWWRRLRAMACSTRRPRRARCTLGVPSSTPVTPDGSSLSLIHISEPTRPY